MKTMLQLANVPLKLCILFAAGLTACGGGNGETSSSNKLDLVAVPTPEKVTALQVPRAESQVATSRPLAREGEGFTVLGTQTVRYGVDSRWMQKIVTSSGDCNNNFFGSDPALGTEKSCELVISPGPTPPPAQLVKVRVQLTTEDRSFTLSETTAVSYGEGERFANKTLPAGDHLCGNVTFGGDPAPGREKTCSKQVEVAPMPPVVGLPDMGPAFNPVLLPPRQGGFKEPRIRTTWFNPTTGAACEPNAFGCIVGEHEKINPSDIGAFREPCGFSHMAKDDPIMFPNQPGKAHLHTFFGNTGVNGMSTQDSLSKADTTCAGGTLNRSAYWIPSLIDTAVGQPLAPNGGLFYYKGNYQFPTWMLVEPFPQGFRVIAGDAKNEDPAKASGIWICYGPNGEDSGQKPTITQAAASGFCKPGGYLHLSIAFPYCWDGVNLDSPDHKGHMAGIVFDEKENKYSCPATHPKVFPNSTFNISWTIHPGDDVSKWRLSSDMNPAAEAGVSAHADYWSNWDMPTERRFVKSCLTEIKDGHAYLTCDGYTLY